MRGRWIRIFPAALVGRTRRWRLARGDRATARRGAMRRCGFGAAADAVHQPRPQAAHRPGRRRGGRGTCRCSAGPETIKLSSGGPAVAESRAARLWARTSAGSYRRCRPRQPGHLIEKAYAKPPDVVQAPRSSPDPSPLLDATRHRKVIRNDGQRLRGVPIQLNPSDGESPHQPEVSHGDLSSDVVRHWPPISSRGRRFKSCPRYHVTAG
jgi:hypothetical protein